MSVALPKAVQQQIKAANELHQQLMAPPPPEVPPEVPPENVNSPVNTAPPPEPTDFEHRYKVLQGKYNAEVPRLQRQVNDTNVHLQQLQQQLIATQGMLASFGQRQAAPAPTPAPPVRLVKDEEINTFGKDLHDFISRTAQETVQPLLEARSKVIEQQVNETRNTATQAVQRVSEADKQRVLALLTDQVENWQGINQAPEFLEWLSQYDPYSGRRRGELLREAYSAYDGPRVVGIFKGFLTEHATVAPPAAAPAPAPQAQAESQRTLEEFTAPGTTKPPGATSAPEGNKRIWTERDVKKFYDDCTAGKYRTNMKRRDEIERDIFAAQAEGRFR
jgi:hypothetical protein